MSRENASQKRARRAEQALKWLETYGNQERCGSNEITDSRYEEGVRAAVNCMRKAAEMEPVK